MIDAGRAIVRFATTLAAPLERLAGAPEAIDTLTDLTGWDLQGTGLDPAQFVGLAADLAAAVMKLRDLDPDEPIGFEDILTILPELMAGIGRFSTFGESASPAAGLPQDLGLQFVEDLLGCLVVLALGNFHPAIRSGFELLGVLAYVERPAIASPSGGTVRPARAYPKLDFDAISRFFTSPGDAFFALFGLSDPAGLSAEQVAQRAFPAWAAFLRDLGLIAWASELGASPGTVPAPHLDAERRSLFVMLPIDTGQAGTHATSLLCFTLFDLQGGGYELVFVPQGALDLTRDLGDWRASLAASGQPGGLAIRRTGVDFQTGAAALSLRADLGRRPGAPPLLRFGKSDGIHVELGDLAIGGSLDVSATAPYVDGGFRLAAKGVRLAINVPPEDGFLKASLPPEGLAAECDLAIAWSGKGGLRFEGALGLEFVLTIERSLGPIVLEQLRINAGVSERGLKVAGVLDAGLAIGPLAASVERIGLQMQLGPRDDGAAGLVFGIGFRPPSGIGLVLDAGPVKGGGYLFFDPETPLYAGAVQLSMKALSFNAVGVVTTRLPDGGDGFSMLLIITAEFPPIQLGFGFSLIGIGGLAGIHRNMDQDALAQCLREGRLGSILFPRDVVANVRRIVDDIGRVFPPQRDRHVFGPMVKIGWGANALLEMDVAVLISLPSPIVIAILGRMRAALPTKDDPVVDLRLEVLGLIDLGRGRLTIEARLVDSRIAAFAVTGGMAMLISWGATKAFALSVGGFNPRFLPPPDFHAPARMGIALSSGENPTFTLTSYFALTSNAVQFGAGADFRLAVETALGVFSVEAYAQFDVLLIFDPPFFAADLRAGIAIKRDGTVLFAARLEASLTGPEPWRINGFVEVQIIVPLRIPFEAVLGEPAAETPPAGLFRDALRRQLAAEILRAENWAALPRADAEAVVSLRRVEPLPGTVLVHPLGGLGFRQRLLPLGKVLRKFGTALVSDPGAFAIDGLALGGGAIAARPVEDDFAPGEFEPLSDDEKLTRPAFESLPAGLEGTPAGLWLPPTLRAPVTGRFEETVMNPDGTAAQASSTRPGLGFMQADTRRFGDAGIAAIAVRPERYVLAEPDTLQTFPGGEAAHAVLTDARRRGAGGAQVLVPAHEAIVVVDP